MCPLSGYVCPTRVLLYLISSVILEDVNEMENEMKLRVAISMTGQIKMFLNSDGIVLKGKFGPKLNPIFNRGLSMKLGRNQVLYIYIFVTST